jgi:hypothetical protein
MIFMSLLSGKVVYIRDILIYVLVELWINQAVDGASGGSCGHCSEEVLRFLQWCS